MDLMQNFERMSRWFHSDEIHLFRETALRGHILRYVVSDDEEMLEKFGTSDRWMVTPFDKEGHSCGEPLTLAFFDICDESIESWIKRTPLIYTEAELPARIKSMDVYGRTSDEEREAARVHQEKAMREFEYELILCQADGTMH